MESWFQPSPLVHFLQTYSTFHGLKLSLDFAAATGAGAVALGGDLPATIAAFKEVAPLLVLPAKAAIAFPLVYHYAGGLRHIIWDKHSIGNQAEKTSYLDLASVEKSSKAIIGTSIVGSLGLALLSL